MAWGAVGNIKGPQGDQGEQGQRGNTWFYGTGVPGVIPTAIAGDLYLDLATGDVYVFS